MKKSIFFLSLLALTSCGTDSNSNAETESNAVKIVEVDLKSMGDSLTNLAMQELVSNVMREMQAGGPAHAVDFCNLHAMPIMDSLSNTHHVKISRVSEKNRNPTNAATEFDVTVLNYLKEKNAKDTLVTSGNEAVYYKTIKLGLPACVKCHGVPNEDIAPETMAIITERYPDDKATGYKSREFRGAWKVVFN